MFVREKRERREKKDASARPKSEAGQEEKKGGKGTGASGGGGEAQGLPSRVSKVVWWSPFRLGNILPKKKSRTNWTEF